MNNPLCITCKTQELTLEGIQQFYIHVGTDDNKLECVTDLFDTLNTAQTVIFTNTKARVDRLTYALQESKLPCAAIHGDMDGAERTQKMVDFKAGKNRVLVATSLLARGVDVQQVSMVLLFDLPRDRETYLHAVGRSGRFGRKGVSVILATNDDLEKITNLERFYNTHIPPMPENVDTLF